MRYKDWSQEEKDDVLAPFFILFGEIALAGFYLWAGDSGAQSSAASGLYFAAVCCALLLVARRSQLREIVHSVGVTLRGNARTSQEVADAVFGLAVPLSFLLVVFVVDPDEALGSTAHISAVAIIAASPVLKAVWTSFRK